MSVSDDIGNLFQRFGGNPDRYQEVARDDDAKHAASRWPLLSALDIAQPEQVPGAGRPAPTISAVQVLSAVSAAQPQPVGDDGLAGAQPAGSQAAATAGDVTRDAAAPAVPRSPLFARSHRHATMPPPVDPVRQAASRFSPPPRAELAAENHAGSTPRPSAAAAMNQPVTPAMPSPFAPPSPVSVSVSPTASAPVLRTPDETTREASRQSHAGFFANRKQTFAPAPITSAAAPRNAQPQPASPAAASRSILSGLFAMPAAQQEPAPSAQPAARDLASLFAKLAGVPGRDQTRPGGERS
jgi:hypothetical protein